MFEHWNNGHRHGRQLFGTLQKEGYRGSYPTLARYLQRLRAAQGTVRVRKPLRQPRPMLVAAPRPVLTSRTLAWLVLRRPEKRSADDRALLAELRRHTPELEQTITLAEEFTGLVRDHAPGRLDPWLRQARNSTAVEMAWSNGPVEGQINRLKAIKRQMYGRAKQDLLEHRFLLAA